METTLVIIKPDGVQRKLVGRIIERFYNKGLELASIVQMKAPLTLAQQHYGEHKEKPFYTKICTHLSSSDIIVMQWTGINAIALGRQVIGTSSTPGTIRGDFAYGESHENVIHASDSVGSALYEIEIWNNF